MKRQRWYYAHLRWAVMVEGKEGLRHWEEAVHIFLRNGQDTAFQRALEIGHQAEHSHKEGRRWVESRLAQVVKLDCVGAPKRRNFRSCWDRAGRPSTCRLNTCSIPKETSRSHPSSDGRVVR
jgi:hypothetical protein